MSDASNGGRDPKRIYRVLRALEHYWNRYPELRLGQIVGNFSTDKDSYYIEDDLLLERIDDALNRQVIR